MRILRLSTLLLISFVPLIQPVFVTAEDQPAAPAPHPYIALVESESVKIGSLEFVAAVQKEWPLGDAWEVALDVKLIITNHGDKDMLFPTFDTFSVGLRLPDGTEHPMAGGRDGTLMTEPVLIPAGGSYCLCRNASITWSRDHKKQMFMYFDGTGTVAAAGLVKGDYTLKFYVGSSPKQLAGIMSNGAMIPLWSGKGETKEAKFKVIEVKQ